MQLMFFLSSLTFLHLYEALMLIFVLCLLLGRWTVGSKIIAQISILLKDSKALLVNKVYIVNVLGNSLLLLYYLLYFILFHYGDDNINNF